jgi:hypothetical protein
VRCHTVAKRSCSTHRAERARRGWSDSVNPSLRERSCPLLQPIDDLERDLPDSDIGAIRMGDFG